MSVVEFVLLVALAAVVATITYAVVGGLYDLAVYAWRRHRQHRQASQVTGDHDRLDGAE